MKPIDRDAVCAAMEHFIDQEVYLHLETTNGAYAAETQYEPKGKTIGAYIRNGLVRFHSARLAGEGPYRAGLQMAYGWIYAEGLTDWELDDQGRLLLAGHDAEGRLAVALQLSLTPFTV